jgi:hypothetical protein
MARINGNWPWPADVGLRGTFPEEVQERRRLERNPDAAPVPELAPEQLLRPRRSSDNLRLGQPADTEPESAESLTHPLFHVTLRRLLLRRRSEGWRAFGRAVEEAPLEEGIPDHRRDQMRTMLRREQAMLELLERYNGLAEAVYSRLLAESKG